MYNYRQVNSSIAAREFCLQKAPYRRIRLEADGSLIGFGDRKRVAATRQQRRARGPVGLILGKPGVVLQRIERRESLGRATCAADLLTEGNGAIDCDHHR